MKPFLTLLLLCITPCLHSQNPLEGKWIINGLLGNFKNDDNELFILTKDGPYGGYSVTFNKKAKDDYFSTYSAECGNDCFPSISGTYVVIDSKHILLVAKTFEQRGYCEKKKISLKNDAANYYIYKVSPKKIFLVKSSGNENQDLQKAKNYLLVTDLEENITSDLRKKKMIVKTQEFPTPIQRVERYIGKILQLPHYEIIVHRRVDGSWAWVYAVKNLDTGKFLYIVDVLFDDINDIEKSELYHYTEAEIEKFRK